MRNRPLSSVVSSPTCLPVASSAWILTPLSGSSSLRAFVCFLSTSVPVTASSPRAGSSEEDDEDEPDDDDDESDDEDESDDDCAEASGLSRHSATSALSSTTNCARRGVMPTTERGG